MGELNDGTSPSIAVSASPVSPVVPTPRRRPRYRVSWIEATGELYALALSEFDDLRRVEILGVVDTHEEVEQLLMGWEALSYGESTLEWVRERAARA